ncbi:MAG: class IV adenylate cyclase [Planctomycetaceae bacterium]|nr:class IV adenylate cyclase [Planctomycetaceae bacterium]|tara:strand:- start:2075 stop:2626 length:552 start_codon:yes stop_codon:yes gene_type:complete
MNYEVEQKFKVDDYSGLLQQLEDLGVCWGDTVRQEDAYFNHPTRDFAVTDEALRVRLDGSEAMFTYKGPRIDSVTKTRQELELQVTNLGSEADLMKQFLSILGFTYVHCVIKQRRKGTLKFQQQVVEVALDQVEDLGMFVEFEVIVAEDEDAREQATVLLMQLTEPLSLGDAITTGYLDMLLR